MLSAREVADYLLDCAEDGSGEGLVNLKLQKLVYYAQGFCLALYGRPLFPEPLAAWAHGPVVPALWKVYAPAGAQTYLPISPDFDMAHYTSEERELLDEVYVAFAQFAGWRLQEIVLLEPPYLAGRERADPTITHADLTAYFQTQLVEEPTTSTPKPRRQR